MNFKKLQADFKTRYNRDITPSCTFAGAPLFLLGDITPHGGSVITALSAGTALAINTGVSESSFSVQDTQTNSVYTCKKEKLTGYHSDTPAKLIFNILGTLTAYKELKVKGAELLYMHNTSDPDFFNTISSLITAIIHLTGETPEKILSKLEGLGFSKKDVRSLKATLMLKKNTAAIFERDSFSFSPLPLSGTKMVIIKTDLKQLYIDVKLKKAFSAFTRATEDSELTPETLSDSSLSQKEQELLRFNLRENQRVQTLKNSPLNLFNVINQSGEEFLKVAASEDLRLLYSSATDLKLHLACRPLSSGAGLYIIIPDNKVDSFIEQFSGRYEKKAGAKPAFYVTDTADSGIGFGVKG